MLQYTAEQVIWTEWDDLQEGVKAQIATGIGNTASEPQGTCRLQRNSVPNDPRKGKRSWITTALSVEMLPDRENRAAGILENKCQNPRQTCMLVITAYKPLNVTLTKIRCTEMEGSKATELQWFRRTEGKYHHLWKSEEQRNAKEMQNYSSPLLKYLFGVPITHLSCYFLQQRPETVWAALAKQKQKQRGEYWELTGEKEQGRARNHRIREKAQPAGAFNAAI